MTAFRCRQAWRRFLFSSLPASLSTIARSGLPEIKIEDRRLPDGLLFGCDTLRYKITRRRAAAVVEILLSIVQHHLLFFRIANPLFGRF
jgi:hypothetical protein